MNGKRNIVVMLALCLFISALPFHVSADSCDDVMESAGRIFAAATAASERKEYTEAIRLYEEAEGYYRKASAMSNCRCPRTGRTALENIDICRENATVNREALENRALYEARVKVVGTYKQATEVFNRGNAYAGSRQWKNAATAFDEAAEIWESIGSSETENGRRALESARKSRRLAEMARQRLQNR